MTAFEFDFLEICILKWIGIILLRSNYLPVLHVLILYKYFRFVPDIVIPLKVLLNRMSFPLSHVSNQAQILGK